MQVGLSVDFGVGRGVSGVGSEVGYSLESAVGAGVDTEAGVGLADTATGVGLSVVDA